VTNQIPIAWQTVKIPSREGTAGGQGVEFPPP